MSEDRSGLSSVIAGTYQLLYVFGLQLHLYLSPAFNGARTIKHRDSVDILVYPQS